MRTTLCCPKTRGHVPGTAWVPSFASNKVTVVLPRRAILACGAIRVGDSTTAIGVVRVIVSVIGAGTRRCRPLVKKVCRANVTIVRRLTRRGGEDADGGSKGQKKVR